MKKGLYLFGTAIIVLCTYMLFGIIKEGAAARRLYSNIQSSYYKAAENPQSKIGPSPNKQGQANKQQFKDELDSRSHKTSQVQQCPQEEEKNDAPNDRVTLSKFDSLLKTNSDLVGWLKVSNTIIDFPVVKTTNNKYYLSYNFLKEKISTVQFLWTIGTKARGKTRIQLSMATITKMV